MRPNIFNLATNELSQDGFFTWLIQWADDRCLAFNKQLNKVAKYFVKALLEESDDYQIKEVNAGRQWNNIDIWVEVNSEYFIAIEDKTDTGEHSQQLERYKQIAADYCKENNFKLRLIYLKTGNESSSSLKKIKEKGYLIIDRKSILRILNKQHVQNDVFNEFREYLNDIDNQTNSCLHFNKITSNWKAGEGFYVTLQNQIQEWTDWRYVANQTGGFLGFWYHWNSTNEIGEIYIQIENSFEKGIKLVIKIADWEQNTNMLYKTFEEIKPFAINNGITLKKPDRYRTGNTSTLAVVHNVFHTTDDGFLDFDGLVKKLHKLEMTIDEYCKNKTSQ